MEQKCVTCKPQLAGIHNINDSHIEKIWCGFMAVRLKFTTWMCQLARQMCPNHDISH